MKGIEASRERQPFFFRVVAGSSAACQVTPEVDELVFCGGRLLLGDMIAVRKQRFSDDVDREEQAGSGDGERGLCERKWKIEKKAQD